MKKFKKEQAIDYLFNINQLRGVPRIFSPGGSTYKAGVVQGRSPGGVKGAVPLKLLGFGRLKVVRRPLVEYIWTI